MTSKKIFIKTFVNKRTKQRSVVISQKHIKIVDPTIKSTDPVYVNVEILKKTSRKK